ncbi:SAF domain-containing protein [Alicyclobacillus sp. ALC3]|uniref:SAF domain-containing protein n=1 Tax=Alicyclobacillus sp. ALC3 TaxID=2796143 RepID=UPI002378581F|nr:SAF domain-containing protein [Alicyclobacillus sp. ALC3]WDL96491.1 SAF domain-containing protein [Alicyclobacillus sp. ALC3]
MRKSTFSFGLGVLCAVLAGVIGSLALHRALNTETVVVATQTLYPYTRISKADVTTVTVPKTSGIAGLATHESTVVGHYLSYSVPKGDPVTAGDLNPSGGSFSTFLTQYTERTGQTGMLMSLPVQTPLASVVNPGEQIALLVPEQNGDSKTLTTIEPVPVLNVLVPAKGGTPTALLIFVSEKNYRILAPAVLNNSVQVALIPQNDSFSAPGSIPLSAPLSLPDSPTSGTSTPATYVTTSPPKTSASNGAAKTQQGGGH